MTAFYHLLVNNLVAGVTNFTVWFAVTFWAYLETQSVLVTGVIGGIYLVLTAGSGIWFGSIVDHNKKRLVMLGRASPRSCSTPPHLRSCWQRPTAASTKSAASGSGR